MTRLVPLILVSALVVACDRDPKVEEPPANEVAEEKEAVSVMREDVIEEAGAEMPVEDKPLQLTIGFPDGGPDLDEAATGALDELFSEEVIGGDDPIRLWGHSDSIGSDEVNERAGQARAEAVRDYLVDKGVEEDRISIVSLGEHNPIAPNLNLDGSDNEDGQAKNRRVEILVGERELEDEEGGGASEPSLKPEPPQSTKR